ncbi:glutathione S-transferase [Penicillium citrinum]|uniref:Glutathione S-transferase n=1 Tax=Penicillium citrinum TaxID=5077 RepID=A0A9W9THP4_PENCI|nr:glutathione S-transferase [Penicillium citrinum]KAJ5223083.1 glutathione S-transferase [Penicillium citrinum]
MPSLSLSPYWASDILALIQTSFLTKHGNGKLVLSPDHSNYADYLFRLHHVNGTLQPALNSTLIPKEGDMMVEAMKVRLSRSLTMMETQLSKTRYIAADEFTAADCMMLFPWTTFRLFVPFSLEGYPNIVAYLQRIAEREAYRVAMEKADPGLERPISAVVIPVKSE